MEAESDTEGHFPPIPNFWSMMIALGQAGTEFIPEDPLNSSCFICHSVFLRLISGIGIGLRIKDYGSIQY